MHWTIGFAAKEFGIDEKALARRRAREGIKPDSEGHWTTAQICAAVFGDMDGAKLREKLAQAAIAERQDRKENGELIEVPIVLAVDLTVPILSGVSGLPPMAPPICFQSWPGWGRWNPSFLSMTGCS